MPILCAMSMTLSWPTLVARRTNAQLTECAVATPRECRRSPRRRRVVRVLLGRTPGTCSAPGRARCRRPGLGRVAVQQRGGERDHLPRRARSGGRGRGRDVVLARRRSPGPPTIAFTAPVPGSIATSDATQSAPGCGFALVRCVVGERLQVRVERGVDLEAALEQLVARSFWRVAERGSLRRRSWTSATRSLLGMRLGRRHDRSAAVRCSRRRPPPG